MAVAPPRTEYESPGDARSGERAVARVLEHWYLLAVSGAVGAVIGVLVLVYPDPSLKLLGVFLGIDLLIAGLLLIVRDPAGGAEGGTRTVGIVLGTLALLAGVLVIRNPGKTIALVAIAFGLYLIVAGALTLGRALGERERRGIRVIRGLVAIAAGTVIVAWPHVGLKTLALLIGLALLIQGVLEIAEALLLRSAAKAASAA